MTNTSIVVEWSKPDPIGDLEGYDSYQINITAPGGQPDIIELGKDARSYVFNNLQSGTEYTISLSSSITNTLSDPISINVFTSEYTLFITFIGFSFCDGWNSLLCIRCTLCYLCINPCYIRII